jgi:hypothetical protein
VTWQQDQHTQVCSSNITSWELTLTWASHLQRGCGSVYALGLYWSMNMGKSLLGAAQPQACYSAQLFLLELVSSNQHGRTTEYLPLNQAPRRCTPATRRVLCNQHAQDSMLWYLHMVSAVSELTTNKSTLECPWRKPWMLAHQRCNMRAFEVLIASDEYEFDVIISSPG